MFEASSFAVHRQFKQMLNLKITIRPYQALKYRSVTDIARPIRKHVRHIEKGIKHSVQPKKNWSSLFV